MDGVAESELHCGSHVDRLLTKPPLSYQDNFAEYCLNRGILQPGSNRNYTLYDLAEWLEHKTQAMQVSRRATELYASEKPWLEGKVSRHLETKHKPKLASVYYGPETTATKPPAVAHPGPKAVAMQKKRERFKPYYPFCEGTEHYWTGCNEFSLQAIDILESRTVCIQVEGVHQYATPLLRRTEFPRVKAPQEAVMALLRANERRLCKGPSRAQTYNEEIKKLEKAGYPLCTEWCTSV